MTDTATATVPTNDPKNWKRRLAGETVPLIDGEPDYGFYRVPTKDRTSYRPVAYWWENGVVRCQLSGKDLTEQQAHELWSFASKSAITYEVYKAVIDGAPWPDLNSVVTKDHNQAPAEDTYESIQERIDDLVREAERMMKHNAMGAQDDATSNQAADVANRLAALQKRADELRTAEKAPHLAKSREIDDKWRPLTTAADIYKRLKNTVCGPWLVAKNAAKKKAEDEARAAADKAAQEARDKSAEAARLAREAAQSGDAGAEAKAAEQAKAAEAATIAANAKIQQAQDIASQTVTSGTRGRGVHLRTTPVIVITDRAKVLEFFKDRQEITDALQALCNTYLKAKIEVPGTKVGDSSNAT